MNRKQKRETSHKLGILQYQQKLTRSQKFNLMRENILAGKKTEQEVKENVRQQINIQIEEKESNIINHLAEDISKMKKIPFIDAIEDAKKEFNNMGRKV